MSSVNSIGERKLKSLVGERSYRLGQDYFQSGAIFDTTRVGSILRARCHGSQGGPYHVRATIVGSRVKESHCSCPVGGGGSCKHVAALLLAWNDDPEQFIETESLDAALARRSKDELIDLIRQVVRLEPELEWVVVAPRPSDFARGTPPSPATYRKQAEAVFRRAGDGWGVEVVIAAQLSILHETGSELLQSGQVDSAAAVFQGLLDEIIEQYGSFDDESGELIRVAGECATGLAECFAAAQQQPALRESILRSLFQVYRHDVEAGGIGLSDNSIELLLEHATKEERQTLAQFVRGAIPGGNDHSATWQREVFGGLLVDLEADALDDEAYLKLCRDTGRVEDLIQRLLSLRRVEQAVAEAERLDPWRLLQVADLFVKHQHGDVAEGLVRKSSRRSGDVNLLEWLMKSYARHDVPQALLIARQMLERQPSIESFANVEKFAQKLGQWNEVRAELLQDLKRRGARELLVQIHLRAGDVAAALDELKAAKPDEIDQYLRLQVAKAAEAHFPREAIPIYRDKAERLIQERHLNAYHEACHVLKKVRALHAKASASKEWEAYVSSLRNEYASLRALLDEMRHARL